MNWLRLHPDLVFCTAIIIAALAGRALRLLGG
jgi:hypothetical protein